MVDLEEEETADVVEEVAEDMAKMVPITTDR